MRSIIVGLALSCAAWGAVCTGTVTSPVVQCGSQEATGNNVLAFGSNNTAANTIIVVATAHTGDTLTISDSKTNTYSTAINHDDGSFANTYIFYAANIAAGANTITVHSALTDAILICILEFSGIATTTPLDKTASASYSFMAPRTGTTAATTQATETLIGGLGYAPSGDNPTTDAAWLEIDSRAGAVISAQSRAWYRSVSSTGTYSGQTAADSGSAGAGVIATFKQAGGGGTNSVTPAHGGVF